MPLFGKKQIPSVFVRQHILEGDGIPFRVILRLGGDDCAWHNVILDCLAGFTGSEVYKDINVGRRVRVFRLFTHEPEIKNPRVRFDLDRKRI